MKEIFEKLLASFGNKKDTLPPAGILNTISDIAELQILCVLTV